MHLDTMGAVFSVAVLLLLIPYGFIASGLLVAWWVVASLTQKS